MAYIKNVNFTHTNYEQGIAIAHIMHINEENGTVTYEYAVVGNPESYLLKRLILSAKIGDIK